VKVGDLVAQQDVIVIDSEATIEDAGATLMNHGITSAPVYDKSRNVYTGMFDFADLVSYILIALKSKEFGNDEKSFEIKEILQRALQPVSVKMAVGRCRTYFFIILIYIQSSRFI
jgi:CBS domain containing-hemolysin-like protein